MCSDVTIIDFNPWWFSGQEDLAVHLIRSIQTEIATKWDTQKDRAKNLSDKLGEFANTIADTGILDATPLAKAGVKVTGWLLRQRSSLKSVPTLKAEIANDLAAQQKRIFVIVDDIDRLSADEIRQLFRTIKALADFPSVMYLLAFDKPVVVKALESVQNLNGEAYLEKVVQVPFVLPKPAGPSLQRMFTERLRTIFKNFDAKIDQRYWTNVHHSSIGRFLNTPRDVVRLTNALAFTYPAVEGEVNIVDFIGIETLRVFCQEVYDLIRANPEAFMGNSDVFGTDLPQVKDNLRSFHNEWLSRVSADNRDRIQELVTALFPKLQSIWGNTYYGSDYLVLWWRDLRVCSPQVFETYFRFSVPADAISQQEITAFLSLDGNVDAIVERLIAFSKQQQGNGTSRVRALIDYLWIMVGSQIADEQIRALSQAFFRAGDVLAASEQQADTLFGLGIEDMLLFFTRHSLTFISQSERLACLQTAIRGSEAVSFICHMVVNLAQEHGKYGSQEPQPEAKQLVSIDELAPLEQLALDKIRWAAQQNKLLAATQLRMVLAFWHKHAPDEAVDWVAQTTADDDGLLEFINAFITPLRSQTIGEQYVQAQLVIDPKWLMNYIDIAAMYSRIQRITQRSDLTEGQRIAAQVFVRAYEAQANKQNSDAPIGSE
jgi:predicted KAP-like P-loop ATPase